MQNIWNKIKYAVWWLLHEWLFDLGWFVGRTLVFMVSDCTVIGRENIPRQKIGVMITSNHLSMWDLPNIHNLVTRPFYTMAKTEFLDTPFVGGWARLVGAFPVKRGTADRKAVQFAIDLLKKGAMFSIFPEGTRSKTQQLAEGHNGAALIALSSNAWIVPVGITGTEYIARKRAGFFARPKVVVRVGKPYKLSRTNENGQKLSIEELTDIMMGKVAELLPPSYQGVYSPEKLAERKEARTLELETKTRRK